jgi:hypothetical protein
MEDAKFPRPYYTILLVSSQDYLMRHLLLLKPSKFYRINLQKSVIFDKSCGKYEIDQKILGKASLSIELI